MASLLERFYDVNHGTITIDNVNIRHLDPSWLRGHAIGFINQVKTLTPTFLRMRNFSSSADFSSFLNSWHAG